jgi:hypothetical protein
MSGSAIATPSHSANGFNHLNQEAGAVGERSAVFVRPVVNGRAEKLGKQIAVRSVESDAVDSRFLSTPRAGRKSLDDIVNLILVHCSREQTVEAVGLIGGGKPRFHHVLHSRNVTLSSAVAELDDVFLTFLGRPHLLIVFPMRTMRMFDNHVARLFTDHDNGCDREKPWNVRQRTGINDPQTLHPSDTEAAV